MKKRIVRVGFCATGGKSWYGGVSYLINVLSILPLEERSIRIEPVICTGYFLPNYLTRSYMKFGRVVRSFAFNAYPATIVRSFIDYFLRKFLGKTYVDMLMDRYDIDILSYGNHSVTSPHKTIFWIPDFQHIHLPQFFSDREIQIRNETYKKQIEEADIVVVSSVSAKKDFLSFSPSHFQKVRVLPFVSTIDRNIFDKNHDFEYLHKKYGIPKKYFFISHQFWQHKNHRVVFESVAFLKKKGIDITIVCSGNLDDWRNPEYISTLKNIMYREHLEKQILFLGFIPYEDVLRLTRYSVAVINPSLFEGWNVSVEEAKTIGKTCILSSIPVHIEQKPGSVYYFHPENAQELSNILHMTWKKHIAGPDRRLEKQAIEKNDTRRKAFAHSYASIIKELL